MIPPIPEKLINAITDSLADDLQSLKTCSVLDRRWTDAARRYIFQTLKLSFGRRNSQPIVSERRVDGLIHCFTRHPVTATSVRILSLSSHHPVPTVAVQAKLSLLLNHLSHVHRFELWSPPSFTIVPELGQSLHHLSRWPLRRLRIDQVTIGVADLIEVLECSRTLERLDLNGTVAIPLAHIFISTKINATKPSLHPYIDTMAFGGYWPKCPSRFTTSGLGLAIENLNQSDAEVMKEILGHPLTSLRQLQLRGVNAFGYVIQIPANLTTLIIDDIDDTDVQLLTRMFENVNIPLALEQLSFAMGDFVLDSTTLSAFQALDRSLAKAELERLTSVLVRITSCGSSEPEGPLQSERFFPLLSQSGRVEITVHLRELYFG